jgi:hypothetical protein
MRVVSPDGLICLQPESWINQRAPAVHEEKED